MVWLLISISVLMVAFTLAIVGLEAMESRNSIIFKAVTLSITALISESLPHDWYHNVPKFKKLLLWIWLLSALILTLSYKSNLLANLLAVAYEKPIETSEDVFRTGLPVYVKEGSLREVLKICTNTT